MVLGRPEGGMEDRLDDGEVVRPGEEEGEEEGHGHGEEGMV